MESNSTDLVRLDESGSYVPLVGVKEGREYKGIMSYPSQLPELISHLAKANNNGSSIMNISVFGIN